MDGSTDQQSERGGGDAENHSREGRSRRGTAEGGTIAVKLKEMKLADASTLLIAAIEETLYYYAFPREHWRCLRTNNPLEQLLREVRRRTRAVGAFPDGKSALPGHEPASRSERSGMNAGAQHYNQTYTSTKVRKKLDTTVGGWTY